MSTAKVISDVEKRNGTTYMGKDGKEHNVPGNFKRPICGVCGEKIRDITKIKFKGKEVVHVGCDT